MTSSYLILEDWNSLREEGESEKAANSRKRFPFQKKKYHLLEISLVPF